MPYSDPAKAQAYQKQYHLKNWSRRKSRHIAMKRLRRIKLALWLKTHKEKLTCSVCGENHPACLDFHHVNSKEKESTIANMVGEGYSIGSIKREMEKCIVLCRNCHAKQHYKSLIS